MYKELTRLPFLLRLCANHPSVHPGDLSRWLVVRDVLHALLVPVVELFDNACTMASTATQASKLEDLEYAFTGSARSAFLWLQCFLSSPKERDWCYTRGCPACVVDHSLDSEFSIRLLYAACLLSDVHYPFTLEGPTLPSFMFFLDALRHSLELDPLWGKEFFELMQSKAIATRDGIEDLIHQCLELNVALSSAPSSSEPTTPDGSDGENAATPILPPLGGTPSLKVKRSKMARRQMRLQVEEEQWREEMRKMRWDQGRSGGDAHVPSLDIHGLDSGVKVEPTVAVTELLAAE